MSFRLPGRPFCFHSQRDDSWLEQQFTPKPFLQETRKGRIRRTFAAEPLPQSLIGVHPERPATRLGYTGRYLACEAQAPDRYSGTRDSSRIRDLLPLGSIRLALPLAYDTKRKGGLAP